MDNELKGNMEAGGVETHSEKNRNLQTKGQDLSPNEQGMTQPANDAKDTKIANIGNRTSSDHAGSLMGHLGTSLEAQQEHNRSIAELLKNPDLKKVVEAWKTLPKAIQMGILAMVEEVVRKKDRFLNQ